MSRRVRFEEVTLADLLDFTNGKAIKPGGEGAYPAYGSNGLIGCSEEARHENAIIIGRVGAYCGSIEFCPTPFWASDNTIVAEPKGDNDVRFLYYLLIDLDLNRWAGGSAQPLLTQTTLKRVPTGVPPVETQRRIAGILSAYDDLIENNTRRIRLLEEMARALYREWFVHYRFPGHKAVQLVEHAELGAVPEGWEVGCLGSLAREVRRGVDPSNLHSDTPYISLGHMPKKSIALTEWGRADEVISTKLTFRRGEILFGKIRPYFHKVGVAPLDGVSSTDAIIIVPKEGIYFGYTLALVSSDPFIEYATTTSSGTKMPRADWKVLVKYPVALPSRPLMKQFDEIMRAKTELIINFIHMNNNLRRTRDLLLPRLVSGAIPVEAAEEELEAAA